MGLRAQGLPRGPLPFPHDTPGACRAHLSEPPSPGGSRCHLAGAAEEGANGETGMNESCGAPGPASEGGSPPPRPLPPGPHPQGYDPEAKAPFQPKPKRKGRSSTGSMVKRKKKVLEQEHRVSGRAGRGWAGWPGRLGCTSPAVTAHLACGLLSPVSRTKSGKAWRSSRSSKNSRRPSPQGCSLQLWTDLCAEPSSRVAWEPPVS